MTDRRQSLGKSAGATCQFPAGGLKKGVLTGSGSVPVRACGASVAMLPELIRDGQTPRVSIRSGAHDRRAEGCGAPAKPIPQGGGNRSLARRRRRPRFAERADTQKHQREFPRRRQAVAVHYGLKSMFETGSSSSDRNACGNATPALAGSRIGPVACARSSRSVSPTDKLAARRTFAAVCGAGRARAGQPL